MRGLFDQSAYDRLALRYEKAGGQVAVLDEGSLLFGLVVMFGDGLKTVVVTEAYLNEWSSAYKIMRYNNMPAKYRAMLAKEGWL